MANEIKKAFEQFKKELNKETGIKGGFTMNCRQIENRTATYAVCPTQGLDETISYFEKWIVENPETAKYAGCESRVEYFKALKAEYGTRENYAKATVEKITGSKAFGKFSDIVGGVKWHIEISKDYCGNDWYYVRFNY